MPHLDWQGQTQPGPSPYWTDLPIFSLHYYRGFELGISITKLGITFHFGWIGLSICLQSPKPKGKIYSY